MAFQVIETQEQLDAIVGERVARAKDSARKEFEGWISPDELTKKTADLNTQLGSLNDQLKTLTDEKTALETKLTEKDGQIAKYETDSVKRKVAREYGLPYEAIEVMQGEDEKAIRKSAELIRNLVGTQSAPPLGNPEVPQQEDGVTAAFKKLNPNIKI